MTNQDFAKLVNEYERLIYTVCYKFVHNHHTAQDLAQETFISAFKNIDTCPEEYLKPWLCRIAANKAKDFLKSAYNRRIYAPGDEAFPETGNTMFMQAEQPEEISIEKEAVALIQDQIFDLKEPYHKVSVMFFIEEKSVDEIALLLDRPSKTVHTQLYRAKNMLKENLKTNMKGAPNNVF